ncbi:MAG: PAS domain S-box protein, partial [Candidatus Hodarchaeales archaeon]
LAEEALRESKEKYQMLIERMEEGVVLEDEYGFFTFVNPRATEIIGYTESELVGKHWKELIPDEELDGMTFEAGKRREGISSTYETKALAKDGSQIPISVTATPLFSKNKEFEGVLTVISDMTKHKKAEAALLESKEKYQMLIEKMEEAVLLEDAGGKIRFVNPKMTSMLGYIEDELLGQHYTFIVPPEFYDQTESETKKRPLGVSSIYESAVLAKNGSSIPVLVSASPIYSITGEFEGVLSVATDITKRKQAEEALQKSEERYRKLVELSPDALTLTDLNANIIMVNQQTVSLYGYEKDELIGKNSLELVAPDDQQRAMKELQETSEHGIIRIDEYKLVKKDGSLFTAEINVNFLTDNEGKPTGFIAVTRDITERIKAREEREKLEKMRKEFMDQAAHELRTPLTIIKGYTEFLQMRETNEENHKILRTIMNNIIRLEELGASVSDIYRIERGKFEVVLKKMDFSNFLQNFLDPYLKLYEGQFHFNDGLKDQVLVNGDSKRLKNVLSNVLDNAIRNTELVIKDNGAGIKPENLERIFDKFTSFSTKYDITGTGIGLYIAREIINAHNGSISAYSEGEDKGTAIRIKLPRIHE